MFRSDIVPAFFFDGEQAQSIINASGNFQVQKGVDVLFGTSVLNKAILRVKHYIDSLNQKTGGKRNFDERKAKNNADLMALTACRSVITDLKNNIDNLEKSLASVVLKLDEIQDRIIFHGGDHKPRMEAIRDEIKEKGESNNAARNYIYSEIGNLALEMALYRYRDKIIDRLEMEAELEKWEAIRTGTELKMQDVIDTALPSPHYHDSLLCDLDVQAWENLRSRFKSAIEGMYYPAPIKCADSYLLVFVNNKDRINLSNKIEKTTQSIVSIQYKSKEIIDNQQTLEELKHEKTILESNSENIKDLVLDNESFNSKRSEIENSLGSLNEKLTREIDTETILKSDIDSFLNFTKQNQNSKTLLNVAERTHNVFGEWLEKLGPLTLDKIISLTTKKFLDIAHSRFKGGRIDITKINKYQSKPVFVNRNGVSEPFETMSGFERRSFGVAYSLALTELTNYRAPLVIDTPLGNADSEYRASLLKALANADLDQIILLSHDEEITEELHNQVLGDKITTDDGGTYFLVEFDESLNESNILPNHYFY